MIPKIIHYCWFGRSPLPPLAKKCISSWKKNFPDYEIIEWNEDNFDVDIIQYTSDAYNAKKYAFVSDYARFFVLNKYGGIYFDTDVEIIKNMDHIISNGPFMGCEHESVLGESPLKLGVATGLCLGVEPNHPFINKLLKHYEAKEFVLPNSNNTSEHNVVAYTTQILCDDGLRQTNEIQECSGFKIYPKEYFCPTLIKGRPIITDKTVSVHYYAASWFPRNKKIKKWLIDNFPAFSHFIFGFKSILRRCHIIS